MQSKALLELLKLFLKWILVQDKLEILNWIKEHGKMLNVNELLPLGYAFVNKQMHKKEQAKIINDLAERYPMIVVAQTVDKLKDTGFYWATRSGVTVSISDVLVPPEKP
mgnify:CR=1 FL=1